MDSKLAIGERIKELRLAQGLTQAQLGKKAGLSGDWVCNIEKGHRRPDLTTAYQLARALCVLVDDLCGFKKVKNHKPKRK